MANWSRGLARIYIVVWVIGAIVGVLFAGSDTITCVTDWRTLRAYLAHHRTETVQFLRDIEFDPPAEDARSQSDVQREFEEAARIAKTEWGVNPLKHVATTWGWLLLLAGVMPALILRTLGWIVAGFRAV